MAALLHMDLNYLLVFIKIFTCYLLHSYTSQTYSESIQTCGLMDLQEETRDF